MTSKLARRIETLAAIEIALLLAAIIVAGALLAFGVYIRTLSNEITGTMAQLQGAVTHNQLPNARAGGAYAAALLLGNGSEIVFLDSNTRVTIYRMHRSDPRPVVQMRSRGDLSGDPHPTGALSQVILGMATAFGLQGLRAHVGNLFVIVRANDATLVSTVQSFVLPLVLGLVVAVVCA